VALGAQAPVEGEGDVGRLLDGAALSQEHGTEGQASHAGVLRVRAHQCVEGLLVLAQMLEEAGQARLGEVERLLAQALLGNGEGACEEGQGAGKAMLGQAEPCEGIERLSDVGVVLAEGCFQDGERALEEWLGPAVQSLVHVEAGEVVERVGDVGVVVAEGRLPEGERALVEQLGPIV
jgi:hypothetical protein